MTDNEIIRPDERIIANYENYIKDGCNNIEKELLDLAKRQKAEIKKLENIERIADKTISVQQAEIEALINGQETLHKHIAEQKAEIERLQARNDELNTLNKTATMDAIKEFAERLKEEYAVYEGMGYVKIDLDTLLKNIDNLVKEMTE